MNTNNKDEKTIRLNKAIANSGLCARRKADELIFNGEVKVNGELVIEPGRQVYPEDQIEVSGNKLSIGNIKPCHLMLHKTTHVVSTAKDPEGRQTVLDFVPEPWRNKRLYPVGRLDFFSEGLIILTDNGELANLLAHPRHHLPRRYEVLIRGDVAEYALETMRKGMTLSEGERLARVEVEASTYGEDTMLTMTLHQGLNRQIRRMCRDLKLTILRLVRLGLGPLELGNLEPGKVRELSEAEVNALYKAAKDGQAKNDTNHDFKQKNKASK